MRFINQKLFAQRLHMARWGRGLSMQQLANQLGLSKATISRWEKCETLPDAEMFIVICFLFDWDMADFLQGQDELRAFKTTRMEGM